MTPLVGYFLEVGTRFGQRPAAAMRGCEASQAAVAVEHVHESGADANYTVVRREVAHQRAIRMPTGMGVVVRPG